MQKSCALEYVTDIRLIGGQEALIPDLLQNLLGNVLSQRFAEGRDFQRMCQSRSDKIRLVQRKDLCLVLESAK